jgi:large subunit ribosomal protein L3
MTGYNLGDKITVDLFKAGDRVDVVGTSKGKGFTGTIKRWNMHIGPKGHGSGYHRGQGSFANQGRYNHGVMPGKHMSGHHGNKSSTILNLTVVAVDVERNAILIKGGLPGPRKSLVVIRSAVKALQGQPKTVKPLINRTPKAEPTADESAE